LDKDWIEKYFWFFVNNFLEKRWVV
jgi:hypothetical protein